MIRVFLASWALLLGMLFLMIGNGLQSSLLGIRGGIEGFSTFELSLVTSAYFLGFLGGSRAAPEAIRRVGHVRVFAALASFISAALILYPAMTYSWAWILLRVVIGFSISGVYVTAESWLNNSASNETRGQTLSLYMITQMVGIVIAQLLLNVADPAGYLLFVIPSVLVSLSFAPILLSVVPTPAFGSTKSMSLMALYRASPLGFVGMFLLGGVFSAQFGMSSVYATQIGLSVQEISIFISTIFVGAVVLQYPIGWASDRMDRRLVIIAVGAAGALGCLLGFVAGQNFLILLGAGFTIGGMSNPLYSLLIAYANDYLDSDDMASASGGFLFINGVGAITGPLLTGWAMTQLGPQAFWLFIAVLMAAIAIYGVYRMTQRASNYATEDDYDAVPYTNLGYVTTQVAVEAAQELYAEAAESIADEDTESQN
ncbi:MAG: MFS transporter [Pseudomonadota bacterium]